MAMDKITRVRGRLLAATMILASVCVVAGHALNIDSTEAPRAYIANVAAHHQSFVAGGVILAIGAFLLIPAVIGLMRLAPARGGTLATVGGVLAAIGAAAVGAGTLMLTVVIGMLAPAHPALAQQVDRIGSHTTLGGLPFAVAPALVIGMVLVGIGLLRARTVPAWLPALLIVGTIVIFFAPSGGASGALLHTPVSVALALLGGFVWRRAGDAAPGTRTVEQPSAASPSIA